MISNLFFKDEELGMSEKIEIFNSDLLSLAFEKIYEIDHYITFKIEVYSDGFSGGCSFCISIALLEKALLDLKYILEHLHGTIMLQDTDSESYFLLRGDKNGFYLSTELNSLDGNIKAIFRDILVDQTITKTLSEGIQCLLNK